MILSIQVFCPLKLRKHLEVNCLPYNQSFKNLRLTRFRIGHDNSGFGGAWFLDKVEIDCPSLGKRWVFPCKRWLAKNKDDGALERELYPEELDTVEYNPCIRYEV